MKVAITIDKELFQWERDRYIFVDFNAQEVKPTFVQFDNKISKYGKVVPIQENKVKIPDSLLEEKLPIMANICIGSEKNMQVVARREFKVIPRTKPDSYIDQENVYKEVIYDGGEEI